MHAHSTPRLAAAQPVAARIADLSEEFLAASPARRSEIGEEIAGLIAGSVVPLPNRR